MDFNHGLSNLEIETTHSSSQEEEEEEEEEVKRNWLDLPPDVMSLIFMKLGTIDILVSAQWVCTSWWNLSRQPHLFHSIHLEQVFALFGRRVSRYSTSKLSERLAREAIDRSCGQLVEFSVRYIATDELLHYISQKSNSLRCIRLVSCYEVSDDGMIEMAKKLPQLVELEIIHCLSFSKDVFETFGRFCPRLCRLIYVSFLRGSIFCEVLAAIAQNMPELRYLNLFGNKSLDNDGLREILDDCPHLESLDLRKCFGLKFAGDLKERCRNIEVLRLPNDPTDDLAYEIECCPANAFSEYDDSMGSYYPYFGMSSDDDDEVYETDYHSYYPYFGMSSGDDDEVYETDYCTTFLGWMDEPESDDER